MNVTSTDFRNTHGIIFFYAVDNDSTFEELNAWLKLAKINGELNIKKILIGNKVDLKDDREVTSVQG
jgi:GTPase SAR1 family protein